MSQTLKAGDFVELDYTGRAAEDNAVFDTTVEETAKENNLHNPKGRYGPVKICVGKNHVIAGLDGNLAGKEIGRTYKFRIPPEEGFGQKDPKLIRLVSTGKFRKQGVNPAPGLQVNLDGVLGTIKTVSGGRTIVDFNHPLSGKELEYEVSLKKLVTDPKEKADAVLALAGAPFKAGVADGKAVITADSEIPEEIRKAVEKALTETVPEIKSVSFQVAEKTEKSKNTQQQNLNISRD